MGNNGSSSNGGNNSGMDSNDTVSIVALLISLIALVGTAAQVAQQYYASAAGYSNCGESVMGNWHASKKRKFRAYELRFEVQFETPVIFVSRPTNKAGPVPDAKIHYIDGTNESFANTRTLPPNEEKDWTGLRSSRVHTADNERATWVTLLSELQSMEQQSQKWQLCQYGRYPPSPDTQCKFEDHTLAVAVQPKNRSWDTMPSGMRKPYATTTMCHLLEIAAMMGIHWKEFDRTKDRYRAEGNGYMITGSHVTDLGTVFTFQICGMRRFEENRVIPVDEVKEMCCGFMPTIFRRNKDTSRLESLNEDPVDMGILNLSSMDDVAETLVLMGCNTRTASYFRSQNKKHGHLFPVAFELIGMLGQTLHVKNSCYRMLPNPTPYHWDKKFFSLRKLMKEFKGILMNDDFVTATPQIAHLEKTAEKITLQIASDSSDFQIPLLDALHSALDQCDDYLKHRVSDELTKMVLREHFQQVMRLINDEGDHGDDRLEEESEDGTRTRPLPRFGELNAASPEERQQKFMDIYFAVVLQDVRRRAVTAFQRRRTTRYAPSTHGREPSVSTTHSGINGDDDKFSASPPSPPILQTSPPPLQTEVSSNSIPLVSLSPAGGFLTLSDPMLKRAPSLTETLETQATDIWCTLVFRMLAWLLLHDFHKRDVQITKSELLGSRLPVYIA